MGGMGLSMSRWRKAGPSTVLYFLSLERKIVSSFEDSCVGDRFRLPIPSGTKYMHIVVQYLNSRCEH